MPDLSDRLARALRDRYTIQRELGSGGMATVYLAEDQKHGRPVALKVLRPELGAVLGPERFLREVRTAARLSHPHILPLHDSGLVDGLLYYVMPYVEGESLRDRLRRERQLPLEDAVQICREVADALSYAHARGVIHRDIKPENILLQSGHAVVADFGIARAIDQAGGEKLTRTGVALGTPAYMSPEQAAEGESIDGRSDLYSLGCVLYEMLAGQPPFTGSTVESLIRQHLTVDAPSVAAARPSVPAWLAAALARSLEKTPADRFPNVAQFADALAARVPASVAPDAAARPVRKRRLAWLPGGVVVVAAAVVVVLQSGRRQSTSEPDEGIPAPRPWVIVADFDGTADPLYRRTARDLVGAMLDQSTVVATLPIEQVRRALELAGLPDTAVVGEERARELAVRGSVGSVVAGQVDRVGSSYTVLLRLVRAESGEVLAAENRTANSDDALIPAIEDAVRVFRERLGEQRASLEASGPMPEVMTPSFAAYQKYLEGERLWLDAGDRRGADQLMRDALALDPDFASAWLFLGLDPEGYPERWAALDQARRRPARLTSAERLRLEWMIAYSLWHLSAALPLAEQRLRERPNDFISWITMELTLGRLRGPDAALEILDQAAGLDPYKAFLFANNRTSALIGAGRRAEARQTAKDIPNELRRLRFLLAAAVLDGAWAEVDSLAPLWERAYLVENGQAATGSIWATILHLVRGEVGAATARAGAGGPGLPLLYELATGMPVTRADTSWAGAFEAALEGDSAAARAALPGLTADTLDYRARSGYWRAAIEAAIAARREDWNAVVQHAGPLLRDRPELGPVIGPGILWLTARARERRDEPELAVALLAELVEPGRVTDRSTFSYGAAHSYLRQHMIVLLARMGRVEEARRHWDAFQAAFTNPDPEVAPLLDEARAALEAAERKAR